MSNYPRPENFEDQKFMPPKEVLEAIGRVSVVSAGIEDQLHALYWKLLSTEEAVGKVVSGDMRSNRMTEDILRIANAAKLPEAVTDDLQDIFKDFKEKNQKRNQILHWIWSGAHEVESPNYKPTPQKIPYTPESVNELADDLIWIETRLDAHNLSKAELLKARNKLGEKADLYAPAPWLRPGS